MTTTKYGYSSLCYIPSLEAASTHLLAPISANTIGLDMKTPAALILLSLLISSANSREWEIASGDYQFVGDLVAASETTIVVERDNTARDLVSIDIGQLCEDDQTYLQQLNTDADSNPEMKMWTFQNGLQIRAAAVEFIRREVTVRRHRGKAYVNDERYDKMPGVYRKTIPPFVSHFEEGEEISEKTFQKWVRTLKGTTRTYVCEGVLFELENGNLYAIPFFFFDDADQHILKRGWKEWTKADDDEAARQYHSVVMRAQAAAGQQKEAERRQIAKLHLQLKGYEAGLFDLWEVAIFPPANAGNAPVVVVVPARNSDQAAMRAATNYPAYRVGTIRKVQRKN